jgi:hypothetical protein
MTKHNNQKKTDPVPMQKYLFRIEGVNIYATVEDTNQLSVQRGSSLLLRQAIRDIAKNHPGLTSISTGASIGLFQFEAANNKKAAELRDTIAGYLNKNTNSRYLTFVVDVVAIKNDDFVHAKEEVIALNRFRQFQQATLVFPPENNNPGILPCAWDNLRPADGQNLSEVERENIGYAKVSFSVGKRHNYGRSQKREFIAQETETAPGNDDRLDYHYTNDLQEIVTPDKNQEHLDPLNNKLAVLYFDGNGFSNIQKNLDCDQLKKFDANIQEKRKAWLRKLIEDIKDNADFRKLVEDKNGKSVDAIRLEILLWGGDELMLAVPAWKGMEVLQHFYAFHKDWMRKETIKSKEITKHLTHAGGLVFCHVKTPIQRIKKLAREIADHIKDEYLGKPEEGKIDKYSRDANLYDYVVLESIDYPTQSWPAFLEKRYTQSIAKKRQPQRPLEGSYETNCRKFNELKKHLPRRQLHRLVNALVDSEQKFADARERFAAVMGKDIADKTERIAKKIFGIQPKEKLLRRQLYCLANVIINPHEDFSKAHPQLTTVMDGDNTNKIERIAKEIFGIQLKEKLPRRQLYRLAHAITNPHENFNEARQHFAAVMNRDNVNKIEKFFKEIIPGDKISNLHWLHLLDLWDYFVPPEAQSAEDIDSGESTP